MNDRRTWEGGMDFEYNDGRGPVNASSPFLQGLRGQRLQTFGTPSRISGPSNPFAKPDDVAMAASPSKSQPPPPSSMFRPNLQNRPQAPAFRNPAFITPQRRFDEPAAEMSGAETSPALTDASDAPTETPEPDSRDDFRNMTITPATRRNIFGGAASPSKSVHASGRGELPRARDARPRDKIRKRKRQFGDRDVGSVRPRLNHESDESDSDWEGQEGDGRGKAGSGRRGRRGGSGWFSSFLTAIHDHPNAPVIMSWWIQCGVNLFFALMGVALFAAMGSMIVSDFRYAAGEARSRLLAEMEACTHEYTKNRCAPKADRLPALAIVCDEWESCMNQDPEKIKSLAISSKHMAVTINEFFNVLSFKAWGFILSLVIVFLLANNLGFSKFRQSMSTDEGGASAPAPSRPASSGPPQHLFPPSQDPKQAFIWAPVTPKNLRRGIFLSDTPETDDSPQSEVKAIMPNETPSRRLSPSKTERDRGYERGYSHSPSKNRSPTKYY
ncbi:hypothetical protein GGTG_04997 [Gaeumannomyces tritici R3-111a-1]|uniref:Brl1/Brr6 domain-containing protein n=1 Tax=Gaeumannomyces tritici (strain R3-111a-1) TaxID=644352 RepID=J3NUP1_GAET3|nr:hypothetical protein GGTG_04997 [Gaeumannomyces tritici R3-111a-1]EJT79915.1 hypothetical protein GGTG_04997 [Gaeumannomyces tritici R3-111a-1]